MLKEGELLIFIKEPIEEVDCSQLAKLGYFWECK